jgi:hypothetical protein
VSAKRESILPGAPVQNPAYAAGFYYSVPVGFPALARGFGRSTGASSSGASTGTVSPFRARHTKKKGSSKDGPFFVVRSGAGRFESQRSVGDYFLQKMISDTLVIWPLDRKKFAL